MAKLSGVCLEVVEKAEWIAIATAGATGPHVVAVWGDYMRLLGVTGEYLRFPVGGMQLTEANLQSDSRVELICATRQVMGPHGPGRGCSILGSAKVVKEEKELNKVRAHFPWARGVLVVKMDSFKPQPA